MPLLPQRASRLWPQRAACRAPSCRLCKRKQQMSLQARRQLGYTGGTGKRDDKRHVLLTEDVAEALKDVSGRVGTACLAVRAPRIALADCFAWSITLLAWRKFVAPKVKGGPQPRGSVEQGYGVGRQHVTCRRVWRPVRHLER